MKHDHFNIIVKWANNVDFYDVYCRRPGKDYELDTSPLWLNNCTYVLIPKTHSHLFKIFLQGNLEALSTCGIWKKVRGMPYFTQPLHEYRETPKEVPKITLELTQEQVDKIKRLL